MGSMPNSIDIEPASGIQYAEVMRLQKEWELSEESILTNNKLSI